MLVECAVSLQRIRNGVVKRYDIDKGYGFVTDIETGEDAFLHATVIKECGYRPFRVGQKVRIKSVRINGVLCVTVVKA